MDFLQAGETIITRLQAMLPKITILSSAELSDVKVNQQKTPAIYVIFGGMKPGQSAGRGRSVTIVQQWVVVVTTRNARQAADGTAAREEAGPLIAQIIQSLSGWSIDSKHTPLTLAAENHRPGYLEGGFFYLPITFQLQVNINAEG